MHKKAEPSMSSPPSLSLPHSTVLMFLRKKNFQFINNGQSLKKHKRKI